MRERQAKRGRYPWSILKDGRNEKRPWRENPWPPECFWGEMLRRGASGVGSANPALHAGIGAAHLAHAVRHAAVVARHAVAVVRHAVIGRTAAAHVRHRAATRRRHLRLLLVELLG